MNPVENYIYNLENEEQRILMQEIHFLILNTIPNVQYAIKWHLPYYSYKGLLCYLHPKKDKINIGFHAGKHLSNTNGILTSQHLKQIRHIEVFDLETMPSEGIREVLLEAAMWNEQDNKLRN